MLGRKRHIQSNNQLGKRIKNCWGSLIKDGISTSVTLLKFTKKMAQNNQNTSENLKVAILALK